MANSLRAKISKLRHDGNITDAEYQELIKKLDGHDKQIREEIKKELWELPNEFSEKLHKIAYEKGRADGIREFAEWISNTEYVANHDSFILPLRGYFTIDEIVKEFNKEQNNGK